MPITRSLASMDRHPYQVYPQKAIGCERFFFFTPSFLLQRFQYVSLVKTQRRKRKKKKKLKKFQLEKTNLLNIKSVKFQTIFLNQKRDSYLFYKLFKAASLSLNTSLQSFLPSSYTCCLQQNSSRDISTLRSPLSPPSVLLMSVLL